MLDSSASAALTRAIARTLHERPAPEQEAALVASYLEEPAPGTSIARAAFFAMRFRAEPRRESLAACFLALAGGSSDEVAAEAVRELLARCGAGAELPAAVRCRSVLRAQD